MLLQPHTDVHSHLEGNVCVTLGIISSSRLSSQKGVGEDSSDVRSPRRGCRLGS